MSGIIFSLLGGIVVNMLNGIYRLCMDADEHVKLDEQQ